MQDRKKDTRPDARRGADATALRRKLWALLGLPAILPDAGDGWIG